MLNQNSGDVPSDSAEWYEACCSADPLVRAAAYVTLWNYLYRVALRVVQDQPDAESLAEDCAQTALFSVHERLAECRDPNAFRAWARTIVTNVALDELRRRRRLVPLTEDEQDDLTAYPTASNEPSPEVVALDEIGLTELRRIIDQAPIGERSRRAVIGRYLDNMPDELLAQAESELSGQSVQPSHIQVTRAKDIAKLRGCKPLRGHLGIAD